MFRNTSRMAKPTRAEVLNAIRRARGIICRKPGDEPLAVRWARHKAAERALADTKLARLRFRRAR